MKKKKTKFKDKIKGFWSKVRKPMIICSFILNGLFILIAIIGCSLPKEESNQQHLKRNYQNSSSVPTLNILTNTVWEFNTNISPLNTVYTWNIDFYYLDDSQVEHNVSQLKVHYNDYYRRYVLLYDGSYVFESGQWYHDYYRTIYITGGSDVSSSTLIEFLTNKATLVRSYIDLTGLELSYWRFYDNFNYLTTQHYYVSFSSNNITFSDITFSYSDEEYQIYFGEWEVYNQGWLEPFRYIRLIGGQDLSNPSFLGVLTGNAVRVSGLPSSQTNYISRIVLPLGFNPVEYIRSNTQNTWLGNWGVKVPSATSNGEGVFFNYFYGLEFTSNGQVFNGISFQYADMPIISRNGENWVDIESEHLYSLYRMSYLYVEDETTQYKVDVLFQKTTTVWNIGGDSVQIQNVPYANDDDGTFYVWSNDNYRILDDLKDSGAIVESDYNPWGNDSPMMNNYLAYDNLSTLELLTLFGGTETLVLSYNTEINDLFKSAFSSWSNIFAIEILPGMTIGLFIFLPLVVTIITLVFRAVKK